MRMPYRVQQQNCARELIPLFAWICGITVALFLHYGFNGDRQMVLGPNSSRMLKVSSVLVEEVQVRGVKNNGLLLYGFDKPPKLSLESNWTLSRHLYIDSYSRQGISLWLNEGSRIWMEWEMAHGSGNYEDMLVVLLKGEHNVEETHRFQRMFDFSISSNLSDGIRETAYRIDEDNSYYIGIVNLSPWRMVARLRIGISSKMYDTSEATSICSTGDGLCKLKLSFPITQYCVLTTPSGDVIQAPTQGWHLQFSFVARLVSYSVIVGCLVVAIYLILNYLGACGRYEAVEERREEAETQPIVPIKEIPCTYRTNEEDPTSTFNCSSEDLYDNKICAICYDEVRDCFLTPCGHSISCYTCAQRIVEECNVCPICRRLIHKVRRLMIS